MRVKQLLFSALLLTSTVMNAQIGKLLFADEFDGTALNTNIWTYDVGRGAGNDGWGNWELQYYTDRSSNVKVDNGNLVLTAKRENFSNAGNNYSFTSGRINSENKLMIKHGMVEIKVKLPEVSNGVWPAVWMMGNITPGWPTKGEIDFIEGGFADYLTKPTPDNMFGSNIHWDACDDGTWCPANRNGATDLEYTHSQPLQNDYIIYRFFWVPTAPGTPNSVAFGKCSYEIWDATLTTKLFSADLMDFYEGSEEFQNPFFPIFNVAVGGTPTGISDPALVTALPNAGSTQSMYVDYLRVYEYNGYGEVKTNSEIKEKGTFGVYADGTATDNALTMINDKIDVWGNTMAGVTSIPAFAGTGVLAFETNPDSWGGMAIRSHLPRNMTNFSDGQIHFKFKHLSPLAADRNRELSFGYTPLIGAYQNVKILNGESKYGFGRDLDVWYDVVIPMSSFPGANLNSIAGLFAMVIEPRTGGTFKFAIDEVYWTDGILPIQSHAVNYGIFNNVASTDHYQLGVDGEFYIWGNTMNAVTDATGFMTFTMNGTPGWSGMAFTPKQAHNLSAFATGSLKFDVKTTTTSTISIGLAHRSGGNFIDLNAGYGYVNDGLWHTVTIPLTALNMDYYKLQETIQLFQLLGGVLTAPLSIDKIRFEAPAVQTCPSSISVTNSSSITEGDNITFTIEPIGGGISNPYQIVLSENGVIKSTSFYSLSDKVIYETPSEGNHDVEINVVFDNNTCTQTILKSFAVSAATSIDLVSNESRKLTVSPNPVSEILTISGIEENAEVTILNLAGVVVLRSNSNKIEVSSLHAGLYIIKSGSSTTKFIKE